MVLIHDNNLRTAELEGILSIESNSCIVGNWSPTIWLWSSYFYGWIMRKWRQRLKGKGPWFLRWRREPKRQRQVQVPGLACWTTYEHRTFRLSRHLVIQQSCEATQPDDDVAPKCLYEVMNQEQQGNRGGISLYWRVDTVHSQVSCWCLLEGCTPRGSWMR